MADRDITGAVRAGRQRDAAQIGVRRRQVVGFGVDGEHLRGPGALDPDVQRLDRLDAFIGVEIEGLARRFVGGLFGRTVQRAQDGRTWDLRHGRRGFQRRQGAADTLGQAGEFHHRQEGGQHVGFGLAQLEGVEIERIGRVATQANQFARHQDLVLEVDQGLAALFLFDFGSAFQNGVEAAEGVQQFGCRLDADTRGARHVIDAVADQRLSVDDQFRRHAELLDDLFAADDRRLDRIEHRHPVVDQLHQVLVGRNDGDLEALVLGNMGIGADQVVGFEAFQLDGRQAKGACRVADQGELRDQVFGRGRPVGLVTIIEFVAEGLGTRVEDDGDVRGRVVAAVLLDQLVQHVAEAGDGADRQAVRLARQGRQAMIGAEDIARAVDQHQAVAGFGKGGRCVWHVGFAGG